MQRAAHETEALVLKRVETGEADLIVTLFSERLGRISALARSARKSRKRFGGSLEPFFTLRARLEERPRSDIFLLAETHVVSARLGLLQNLERLNAAGRALAWIREAAPPRTPEPEVWQLVTRSLDRLADAALPLSPDGELAELGLALLGVFGWGIDFERCVSCGRPCPERAPASVDPVRGGLVCRHCGGGRVKLSAEARARFARAAAGEASALDRADMRIALELVERVFLAHAGVS